MIPPGIGLILYGTIGEVSIGRLFTAGIVPGLLLMLFMMIAVGFIGKKRDYKPEREKMASFKEIGITFIKSIWAFLFPIFLIVGLRFGYFTPSEAGAFAVLYAFIIGILAYRDLTWKKFLQTLQTTIIDIGVIMVLIAMSGIFSYGIVWERIPQLVAEFLLGITDNGHILLIIMVIFLLIAGMFMDSTVLILLLTSILLPVVERVGIDPVHFGIVMVLTLTVGLLTPPVGIVLYSVSTILGSSIGQFLKESLPLFIVTVLAILLIIFIPEIALFLPNLVFGK
jgi:tripartite ATP-independent transporter DctM subunit